MLHLLFIIAFNDLSLFVTLFVILFFFRKFKLFISADDGAIKFEICKVVIFSLLPLVCDLLQDLLLILKIIIFDLLILCCLHLETLFIVHTVNFVPLALDVYMKVNFLLVLVEFEEVTRISFFVLYG